jgi:hypothetical protein
MEKEWSVGKIRILGTSCHVVGEVLYIKDTTFKPFKVLSHKVGKALRMQHETFRA